MFLTTKGLLSPEIINSIVFRLGFPYLALEHNCLRKIRKVDLIYCHILQLAPFLSLLKRTDLLKTPVLAIAHDAFSERFTLYKTWRGIDIVLSFGEKTRDLALAKHDFPHNIAILSIGSLMSIFTQIGYKNKLKIPDSILLLSAVVQTGIMI